VGTDSAAEEETETWSHFKVATVCLGLLCFLLLTSVVGVAVLREYHSEEEKKKSDLCSSFPDLVSCRSDDRDVNQLSRDLANHTAERRQLVIRNQNLTDERDRLEMRLKRTGEDRPRTDQLLILDRTGLKRNFICE